MDNHEKIPFYETVTFKISCLSAVFIFFVGWVSWKKYMLEKYKNYTIAVTHSTYYTSGGAKKIIYTYKVSGKEYEEDDGYDGYANPKVPGGRYFVKFSSKRPDISDLLQDKPVPDSIKEAPPEGWEKLPEKKVIYPSTYRGF